MSKRHFALILCLQMLAAATAEATTLSVQVVQIDKTHNDVTDSSLLIEESVLDYLFSQGIIVSTSPIIIGSSASDTGYAVALNDARSGSVDYLVYISLYYDPDSSSAPDASILRNIGSAQWRLVRVSDNKQTASGRHTPGIRTETDNSSEGIISFGRQIAASINSSLKKR